MTSPEIRFNRPDITESDRAFLADAIRGGHSSGNGVFTQRAETLLQDTPGTNRALLTTSCTHALEMSALLCNLAPDDEVIVPSYTFVSSASAFAMFGAKPVFVDSRRDTLNIDANLIEQAITPRTKAICIVHYGGVACEIETISALAKRHNLALIEDNAHGLFAKYKGRSLGTFGAMATQSFHETKNITCGEGGALLINDERLVERAEILRDKGTNRSKFLRGQVDKYTWVDIGSSWVLSDLLAAILWGQLQRADRINSRRVDVWNRYHRELATWAENNGVLRPYVPDDCEHVGHLYHLRFQSGDQRTRFIEHMRRQNISCVFHYQPLHASPIGLQFGGRLGQCPVSEHAGDCLVRLPLFNTLGDTDQARVIEAVQLFRP
ncbi:MAG: dTDP-4-amino-4,6-dideoxygalactose transaminase [Oxalobacteraceae bacterium]|nr:dTDP-4-amino-4,6-dideoxygalactose transaminase [Oxalobacteraceae bacterium]